MSFLFSGLLGLLMVQGLAQNILRGLDHLLDLLGLAAQVDFESNVKAVDHITVSRAQFQAPSTWV
jgi:hypothetical protein